MRTPARSGCSRSTPCSARRWSSGLRAQLAAAQAALAAAQSRADAAHATLDAAQTAELDYARGLYADAQTALADATQAIGAELARLMSVATTSSAVTATIDGLGLRARYRAGLAADPPVWDSATVPLRAHPGDAPFDPQIRLPAVGDDDYEPLLAVLADLDDAVDAVADVVAAESVHHLVAGNLARTGAALEIAASGTVTDEPDVIAFPAPAYDLTHRVLALTAPDAAPAWTAPPGLVATVDPAYANWLTQVLPDPATVRLGAEARAADGSAAGWVEFTGDGLGLDGPGWLRVGADAGELAARVAIAARPLLSAALGSPWSGPIVIAAAAPAAGSIPLAALTTACAAVRSLLTTARAVRDEDLLPPDAPAPEPAATVVAAAVAAAKRAQGALAALDADLAAAATAPAADTADVIALLLRASDAGLAEATPPTASGDPDPIALVTLATAARSRLATRTGLAPFAAAPGGGAATLGAARDLVGRLCAAPTPLLLPVSVPADSRIRADIAHAGLPGATPPEIREWLSDHARVRPAIAALVDIHDAGEAFGAAANLDLRATQSPRTDESRWAGADPAPPAGSVDVVVAAYALPAAPAAHVTGLSLDSWSQAVPAATLDTAVAFHFDEPRSDAPQSILVAVAADQSPDRQPSTWAVADLVGTVTSTMALARQRAVAADLVTDAWIEIGGAS